MKLRLFLTSGAAICLVWSAAALADPPADRGQGAQDHAGQQAKGGQDHNPPAPVQRGRANPQGSAPAGISRASGQDRHTAEARRQLGPAPVSAPAARPTGQRGAGQGGGPEARQAHAPSGGFGQGGQGPVAHPPPQGALNARTPQGQSQPQGQARPPQFQAPSRQQTAQRPAPPPLSGWNRNLHGAERERAGQQWRQTYSGWDRSAPWRENRQWWRGDTSFRLFMGPRVGFFFFPDIGYVSAPQQYRDHRWQAGEYLPDWFWRYSVRDYRRYGLPRPPDGCEWVWLNGDVALIDASDGYIIDVVRDVW